MGYLQGSVGLPTGQCGPTHRAVCWYPQGSVGLSTGQHGPTHSAAWAYPQASVGLPTGQRAGTRRPAWAYPQGSMLVFCLLSDPNMDFSPLMAEVALINVKFHKRSGVDHDPLCQISRLLVQKYRITAPGTVKISNFVYKFVLEGRIIWTVFTSFSTFVCICR